MEKVLYLLICCVDDFWVGVWWFMIFDDFWWFMSFDDLSWKQIKAVSLKHLLTTCFQQQADREADQRVAWPKLSALITLYVTLLEMFHVA